LISGAVWQRVIFSSSNIEEEMEGREKVESDEDGHYAISFVE
jgi:hypothetical protein